MSIYLRDPETGKVILAKNTRKPKMTIKGTGRSWDWLTRGLEIGGEEVDVHYDSTWGVYAYFERDGHWYKVDLTHAEETFPLYDDSPRGYPANYDILRGRERLEKVPRSAYDAFLEETGGLGE
jgi:hypothetical protein